jgi:hypothetical protein
MLGLNFDLEGYALICQYEPRDEFYPHYISYNMVKVKLSLCLTN